MQPAGISLYSAGLALYDPYDWEQASWQRLHTATIEKHVVVSEETIDASAILKNSNSMLEPEGDVSRHYVSYDDLNRSRHKLRPIGHKRHLAKSPYDSEWNQRVLSDYYQVKTKSDIVIKRSRSRITVRDESVRELQLKRSNSYKPNQRRNLKALKALNGRKAIAT